MIDNFGILFNDEAFHLSIPLLSAIPFVQADVAAGLSKLQIPKALAPEGFPAMIWQYVAKEIYSIVLYYSTGLAANSSNSRTLLALVRTSTKATFYDISI